jgi:Flp pilus assembly protein TadD
MDGLALGRLGTAQYRSGDYAAALVTLERAEQRSPVFPIRSQIFVSMAYHRLGRADQARLRLEQVKASLERQPGSEGTVAPLRALMREAEALLGLQRGRE